MSFIGTLRIFRCSGYLNEFDGPCQGQIQDSMEGGSMLRMLNFEAMPTFALTTPIFDQRPCVLSHPSHLAVGSRPEIACSQNVFAVSEVGRFCQVLNFSWYIGLY